MIPPFNEFFPEQLYLKNFQAASAFFRNFLSCPPPTGRVPSDTISTNQFQISRVNKKQGCLTTKPSIFPFHAAHPPLGTCGQVILCQQTSFKFPAQIKKKQGCPPNLIPRFNEFFPDACLKRNLNETFPNGSTYSNILVQ